MDASKPNILVVDDEMGPRESLKMILNPYYNVLVADRGAQAIEMLKRHPVDLVTLDLKMPGLTGINVLEKVKAHDPDIEAIIITGYGSLDTAIEGLRLGAFDYISKPFDVNHILSLVRRGLERRTAKAKLRQVKSDFLSNVSHELRTPLSVVVGFVYLLLNQVIGKLSEEQQKVLETVYRNSEELLELIDNVLWMTSLNAGDANASVEKFDARDLVKESVDRHEKMIRDKGLQLNVQFADGDLSMVNDRAKVERVFQNIFNNSVKFTDGRRNHDQSRRVGGPRLLWILKSSIPGSVSSRTKSTRSSNRFIKPTIRRGAPSPVWASGSRWRAAWLISSVAN